MNITCQDAEVKEQKQSTDEWTHREIYKQINPNLYVGFYVIVCFVSDNASRKKAENNYQTMMFFYNQLFVIFTSRYKVLRNSNFKLYLVKHTLFSINNVRMPLD